MKLMLVYGNGISAIHQKVGTLKKEFNPMSVVIFSGKEISYEKALIDMSTPQLFSEKRLVILENFEDKIDLTKLPSDDPDLSVVVVFLKQLTATNAVLKAANSLKAQVVQLTEKDEIQIFPFLDMIAEKNLKALEKLDFILQEQGGQYLLTMISFMLRRLVNPPKTLPPFVLKKIAQQQKIWTLEKIAEAYKLVLETDFKIKQGLIEEKMGLSMLLTKLLSAN